MNRSRLENVRDTIRKLDASGPGKGLRENEVVTDDGVLTQHPDRIGKIDTLDMGTYHSRVETEDDCRTLGCIAGVAITLYANEAREIAMTADNSSAVRTELADIAQRILDLSATECRALFSSHPLERSAGPVTPPEACAAIDRLLAGVDPKNIWDYTQEQEP